MSYSIELISETTKILKNALRNKKLKIHPVPKENELLSSWIIRLAVSNGLTPYAFMSIHFRDFYYLLRQDMDSTNKLAYFKMLSYKTGLPVDYIENLSLTSYDGIIFITDEKTNKRPLLLYLTNKGGYNKTFGYRYCPFCLKENEYLKKEWRLVFSTVCLKHKVFLLDRCPNCNKPLSPFIWRNLKTTHFHCPHCNYEYKNATEYTENIPKDSEVSYYQEKLYKIIGNRKFKFDDKEYFSVLFFPVLAYIVRIIFNWNRFKYDLLDKEKELLNLTQSPNKKAIYLFSLSVKEHALLFTVAMDILSNKENFDIFVKNNKITHSKLNMANDKMYVPYWYERLINNYKIGKYVSLEETKNAIKYLKSKGIKPSFPKLREIFGIWLESKKRMDIKEILKQDNVRR